MSVRTANGLWDARRPPFLSLPMWFAWLLRSDVRGDARPDDAAAQRDFVAWWILWGRQEYAAGWSLSQTQVDVAMEPVPVAPDVRLPRLLRHLWVSRPDLQAAYPLDGADSAAEFLCWYRWSGAAHLPFAPALSHADMLLTETASSRPIWRRLDVAVPHMAACAYDASDELRRLFPADSAAGQAGLRNWYLQHGRAAVPVPALLPQDTQAPRRVSRRGKRPTGLRPAGVNIVGFARGELGIGEDTRMLSAALDEAEVPHVVIDVPAGPHTRRDDRSTEARIRDRPAHPITVLCLSTFDTATLRLTRGEALFRADRTIGCWPWELPAFPSAWRETADLVDELWAATTYTRDCFATGTDRDVHLLPPAVALPELPDVGRAELGLPTDAFLFVCPFDPNSYLARKNPQAAVRAFRAAFPARDQTVGLVLRANGNPQAAPGWNEVMAAAQDDPRILCVPGTLPRPRALALLRACDALVSPHRAEGYGRNIAEAILLHRPVLATGFSGCVDFLQPQEMIAWTRRDVGAGDYPFADGMWWAEPDEADLARRMQALRAAPPDARWLGQRARAFDKRFSPAAAGRRYAKRLTEICRQLG